MSHDRGCPCGRERAEYDTCSDEKCFKKKCDVVFDFHSKHNNEYWYKCNTCGATDWFAYYDRDKVERNNPLNDCKNVKKYTGKRAMKTEKQYLWVKEDRAPMIVTDLITLYKDRDFDSSTDKIYEIGPEVKIELNVKVTPATPVYRENASGYRTPFENRD